MFHGSRIFIKILKKSEMTSLNKWNYSHKARGCIGKIGTMDHGLPPGSQFVPLAPVPPMKEWELSPINKRSIKIIPTLGTHYFDDLTLN
jgi:hypothetical protein